jgi:hypothetical protein
MAQRTRRAGNGELTQADLRGGSMAWDDRRGGERIPCERQVAVLSTRAPWGEGFRAAGLFDCSAHGIGIVSDRAMQVGEQFIAKVQADSASLAVYTVRRCIPAGDGRQFNIGAALTAFVGPPGDSLALDALLPARATPASKPASKPVHSSSATAPRRRPASKTRKS